MEKVYMRNSRLTATHVLHLASNTHNQTIVRQTLHQLPPSPVILLLRDTWRGLLLPDQMSM